MTFIKRLLTLSVLCTVFASCDIDEHELDMEILVSTVWLDVSDVHSPVQADYVYDFDSANKLTVYEIIGTEYTEKKSCRYIFTPYEEYMVIETEGEYEVEEISVDRLVLENSLTRRTFIPYTGDADIPKKIRRK